MIARCGGVCNGARRNPLWLPRTDSLRFVRPPHPALAPANVAQIAPKRLMMVESPSLRTGNDEVIL